MAPNRMFSTWNPNHGRPAGSQKKSYTKTSTSETWSRGPGVLGVDAQRPRPDCPFFLNVKYGKSTNFVIFVILVDFAIFVNLVNLVNLGHFWHLKSIVSFLYSDFGLRKMMVKIVYFESSQNELRWV